MRTDQPDGPTWPIIILVNPQLGENIGTAARAMLNNGLYDMRLVAPRDGWPNEKAVSAASGATVVLDRAQVFPDVASAVADLHRVYATTARRRDMVKPVFTPRSFPPELRTALAAGQKVGVLFGAERSGLKNEDVVRSQGIIEIPANPDFTSFNLAQAVLVIGYECFQARLDGNAPATHNTANRELASAEAVDAFLEHLDRELDDAEYYREPNLRATMQRNLHNIFRRAELTDQEVRSLRGVVARLAAWRVRRPPKDG